MTTYGHAGYYPPDYWPNQHGHPTPGGLVGIYVSGTLTLASLWADRDRTIAAANPITLDALGNSPEFFAEPGEYDASRITNGAPGTPVSIGVPVDDADAVAADDWLLQEIFSPYNDIYPDPVHAVWASDRLWTQPADGAGVSSIRNQSSVGGANPEQVSAGLQPVFRAAVAALNNRAALEFDGVDDYLQADIVDIVQPFKAVAVVYPTVLGDHNHVVLGRGALNTSNGLSINTAKGWREYYDTQATGAAGIADTNPHIARFTVDGAASEIFIDGSSVGVVDPGPGSQLLFLIGAGFFPTYGNFFTGFISFLGLYDAATDDGLLERLEQDLGRYYDITIGVQNTPITEQTSNYTLTAVDANTDVHYTGAIAGQFEVSSVLFQNWGIGTVITFRQMGVGQLEIVAGSGVTLRAPHGRKLSTQYATASIVHVATDVWVVSGDTSI